MGAYLGKPKTEKEVESGENERIAFATASMQGWRVSQEDAHNAILEYDVSKSSSLFAVYDGHGGSEVAEYVAQKLPHFLKTHPAYDTEEQLHKIFTEGFVSFDASLLEPSVLEELRVLKKKSEAGNDNDSDPNDQEELNHLCEEASMPIEDVIAQYNDEERENLSNVLKNRALEKLEGSSSKAGCSGKPISPFLRAKRNALVGKGSILVDEKSDPDDEKLKEGNLEGAKKEQSANEDETGDEEKNDDKTQKTDVNESKGNDGSEKNKSVNSDNLKKELVKGDDDGKSNESLHDDSVPENNHEDTHMADKVNSNLNVAKVNLVPSKGGDLGLKMNTDSDLDSKSKDESVVSGSGDIVVNGYSNGNDTEVLDVKGKGIGKGKGKSSGIKRPPSPTLVEEARAEAEAKNAKIRKKALKEKKSGKDLYKDLLKPQDDDDEEVDDSDDEDDVDFGHDVSSDEDDQAGDDHEEEGDEEDDEEDEEEDDSDSDEEVEYDEEEPIGGQFNEEPGNDSGCTAVVALLRGESLMVANAGDSRCVVCREGKAVDMSFDHKPEDTVEIERITKAGGRVTMDGRVNGGLNLSRALGDHAYKTNKDLSLSDQMISPVPDIKTLQLDRSKDTFMILACDGIWNSMSSQEVIDFVNERLNDDHGPSHLTHICEELFDVCLAPNTLGDGTGCDNMTAVLVVFKDALKASSKSRGEVEAKVKEPIAPNQTSDSSPTLQDQETPNLKEASNSVTETSVE